MEIEALVNKTFALRVYISDIRTNLDFNDQA